MKNLKWSGLVVATVVAGLVSPVLAHHSHAMFDHTKQVSFSGTVTEFVYRNPHVFLYVDVKSENGETVNYWVEMSNLTNMIRRGIGQTTFKPGDTVKVNLHPLKDGRPGGSYVTIITADGKIYD
jgi:hypothetical protein